MDKTISQLSQLTDNKMREEDVIPVSHHESQVASDFVTYKINYGAIREQLSNELYPEFKKSISAALGLKAMAWQDDVKNSDVIRETPGNRLDIVQAVEGYGDLALKNEVQLGLSALAYKDVIDLASAANLSGRLQLDRINYSFGDLISVDRDDLGLRELSQMDKDQLELSALAHKDKANLAADTTGPLDFKRVSNRPQMVPYALSVATASDNPLSVGGVNLGYYEGLTNPGKNYKLQVNDKGQAYVHVPWQNDNTIADYTFVGGQQNKFTVKSNVKGDQEVTVIPNIPNNITGTGKKQAFAVFTDTRVIGAGLEIGTDTTKFLRNDGSWAQIPPATQTTAGIMTAADKKKLDSLANYGLPMATATTLGGVKVGYTAVGKNYPERLDANGQAYVNVPWSDTNTTYTAGSGLTLNGTQFSLNYAPTPSIKFSNLPISESQGSVYSGSSSTGIWTSPGDCQVNVSLYLKVNVSSCGHKDARYVYFKPAGTSTWNKVLTMEYNRSYFTSFICKANDQIKITGWCSSSHATEYYISGTYLSRS